MCPCHDAPLVAVSVFGPDVPTRLKVRLPSCDRRQVLRQGFLPQATAVLAQLCGEMKAQSFAAELQKLKGKVGSLELISI